MASLVLAAATPHNPLLWRTMTDPVPDDLRAVRDNFALIRDALTDAGIDALVVAGTDHVRQFFADNVPAFIVGRADSYHGTFENEARAFGLPYVEVRGEHGLADAISGTTTLPETVDFATSAEWRLDHSYVLPLLYLTPELDLPIVPVNANSMLPPLPHPGRFAAVGEHLRRSIEAWNSDARVALITSGHMATEIGGPRQFMGGGSIDPEFDAEAVSWMAEGDLPAAIEGCTFDRVIAAGNVTYQYLNVLIALAAMGGKPADLAEATENRFASSPFFLWRA